MAGGKQTTAVAFFGIAREGGLGREGERGQKIKGGGRVGHIVVVLVVLVIIQVEDGNVMERWEGGVGDDDDYDNDDWTDKREGECW